METSRSTPSHNIPAIVVGVVAIATASLGLLYNATTISSALRGDFSSLNEEYDVPYFYQALFIMSAICVACYLILVICGVSLVRSRLGPSRLVTLVLIFEIGYLFAIGSLWLEPTFWP